MGEKKGVRTKEEGARKGGRKDEGEGDRKSAQRAGGRRESVHSPNCFYHLPVLLTQHRQTSRKKNETLLSIKKKINGRNENTKEQGKEANTAVAKLP